MPEDHIDEVAQFVRTRRQHVLEAAVAALSSPDRRALPHVMHQFSGTLATFQIPNASRLAELEDELLAGGDEELVRRRLAEFVDELRALQRRPIGPQET